jgi:hypothetical protein
MSYLAESAKELFPNLLKAKFTEYSHKFLKPSPDASSPLAESANRI